MKRLNDRNYISVTKYYRSFVYANHPGCGFAFDCDSDGNVHIKNAAASANYKMCLIGIDNDGEAIIDRGVQEATHSWVEPAAIECCGERLELDRYTNTCPTCSCDYDMSGNTLAPREFWGEETGEHISDILMIGNDNE